VHRFFNERTKRIIMSRDVQWLKKVYGDWKGGLSKAKKKQRVEYVEVDVPSGNDDVPTGNGAVPPVNDEDSDDSEEEALADPVESDDESFDEVGDNEEVGMEEEPKGSPARTLPIRQVRTKADVSESSSCPRNGEAIKGDQDVRQSDYWYYEREDTAKWD